MLKQVKPKVRDFVGELLYRTGLSSPRRWAEGKLTIVTFHRVLPADLLAEYPIPEIVVTPEELRHFVTAFQEHYTVGTLAEMAALHRSGNVPARPLLAITFDDGQLDNYEYALPVLRECGVAASFFVVTDAIEYDAALWPDRMAFAIRKARLQSPDRYNAWLIGMGQDPRQDDGGPSALEAAKRLETPRLQAQLHALEVITGGQVRPHWDGMMRWPHLEELVEEGHEVGSHSVSHPILPLLTDEKIQNEIVRSKDVLEQNLGRPVLSFCYPNGSLDQRALRWVREAGYMNAVSTRYGLNGVGADPLCLSRIGRP